MNAGIMNKTKEENPIEYLLRCLNSEIPVDKLDITRAINKWNDITSREPVCWARLGAEGNAFCLIRNNQYPSYIYKDLLTPLYRID